MLINNNLLRDNQMLVIENLILKELQHLSIVLKNDLPASTKYFPNISPSLQAEWKGTYLSSREVSIDTNLRMLQYKILKNILCLNKQLITFNNKNNKLFTVHSKMKKLITYSQNINYKFAFKLWSDLKDYYQCSFDLAILNLPCATFKFLETDFAAFIL